MYASVLDLRLCGAPSHIQPFCFYTYYRKEDVSNQTVGEYMQTRKLFRVDELEMSDFPD